MRVLFLTPGLPYPPRKGTAMRNFNLIKGLALHHPLSLVSFGDPADSTAKAALGQYCQRIEVVPARRRSRLRRLAGALFSPTPDLATRLASPELGSLAASLVDSEGFDLVQVEGLEMAPHGLRALRLARRRKPALVLDAHNAEYVLQQRIYETDRRRPATWPGAAYSFLQWRKLLAYEGAVCQECDGVVAVSSRDREAILAIAPQARVAVVPNGVDTRYFQPSEEGVASPEPSLLFTGTMDFRPNVDAVHWFCRTVFPLVLRERPEARFYIVGRDPKEEVLRLQAERNVVVIGAVEDERPYFRRAAVYVAPLRTGGGLRLKVLQAMAMGVPLVTTSLGCEGVGITSGQEALVTDQPQQFARAVLDLLSRRDAGGDLARKARELAVREFDWRIIVPRLESFYEQLLGGRPSGR